MPSNTFPITVEINGVATEWTVKFTERVSVYMDGTYEEFVVTDATGVVTEGATHDKVDHLPAVLRDLITDRLIGAPA